MNYSNQSPTQCSSCWWELFPTQLVEALGGLKGSEVPPELAPEAMPLPGCAAAEPAAWDVTHAAGSPAIQSKALRRQSCFLPVNSL